MIHKRSPYLYWRGQAERVIGFDKSAIQFNERKAHHHAACNRIDKMTNLYDGRVATFMEQLVDGETNLVRFRTLVEIHSFLMRQGFQLSWKEEEYGPKGGWQLFYHGGGFRGNSKGMIVRIKTHGEKKGKHRAFKPHLSVTWQEGMSPFGKERCDYAYETSKFNPSGVRESKDPPPASAADRAAWAHRTHPLFPGFESSSELNPMGLYGAESLSESGATAG